jgi:hypothetical protein
MVPNEQEELEKYGIGLKLFTQIIARTGPFFIEVLVKSGARALFIGRNDHD